MQSEAESPLGKNSAGCPSYYLLYAVLAEFEVQLNDYQSAAAHLRKAIQLTEIKSEQSLLSARLKDCEEQSLRMVHV